MNMFIFSDFEGRVSNQTIDSRYCKVDIINFNINFKIEKKSVNF